MTDSACYSARENAAITRGLLELRALRATDSARAVVLGYYASYRERVGAVVARYAERRAFLGIGNKRQKRKLKKEIHAMP